MSNVVKTLLGGAATAALTWFLYGPMGLGTKCAATPVAGPATIATPAATATAPTDAVPAPAPQVAATAATVTNCQSAVDTAIKGKTINFGSGNAEITSYSMPVVEALAAAAKDCAGTKIEVAGHTDQQGSDAPNMKLSDARANAVLAALAQRGVPKERMTAKGYGETKLIDTGSSREALAKNRRIEFTVSSAAPAATDTAAQPAG
jgi:outer membrane protein OmpA-like peptidoglycan-associated protein